MSICIGYEETEKAEVLEIELLNMMAALGLKDSESYKRLEQDAIKRLSDYTHILKALDENANSEKGDTIHFRIGPKC